MTNKPTPESFVVTANGLIDLRDALVDWLESLSKDHLECAWIDMDFALVEKDGKTHGFESSRHSRPLMIQLLVAMVANTKERLANMGVVPE